MDKDSKKTLEYMQNRDWIAQGAILSECPEASEILLHKLRDKGYLEHQKYVGIGNTEFFRPTDKSKRALLPFWSNVKNYLLDNWLALLGIALAMAALLKR